jgi:hypothetical protein
MVSLSWSSGTVSKRLTMFLYMVSNSSSESLFSVRLEFSVRNFPKFNKIGRSWRASMCFPEVS